MHSLIFCEADSRIGRVDYHLLPQQTLMEVLVNDLLDKSIFCDANGTFRDIDGWAGVKCTLYGEVESVKWSNLFNSFFVEGGTIHLEWMPATVQTFDIFLNWLSGEVDLTGLPSALHIVVLSKNKLEGEANLTALPQKLRFLYFANNRLTGPLRISNVPPHLKGIDLSKNKLCGSVDLTCLSGSIEFLYLQNNDFGGQLRVSSIPNTVWSINLTGNHIDSACDKNGIWYRDGRIAFCPRLQG